MASDQQDPIPAVSGDNVDERYEALTQHLHDSLNFLAPYNVSARATCPHIDASTQSLHLVGMGSRGPCVVCHDCKALVLAYEAKQRMREQDAAKPAEYPPEMMGEAHERMTATKARAGLAQAEAEMAASVCQRLADKFDERTERVGQATAKPEPRFAPGDIVMLKSGGPMMTLEEMIYCDTACCRWFVGEELKRADFRLAEIFRP